jgi:magnesium transporter
MISYYYRSVREEQLKKLDKFRVGAWIVAEAPTREALEQLSENFSLDNDLLGDALDPDEIPRSEMDEKVVYVYMRYAYRQGDSVETETVLVAIGPKFVATVSRRPFPDGERLLGLRDLVTTQRLKLLVLLLRHLVHTYESNLRWLDRRIRSVRAKLRYESIVNKDFVEFVQIEDSLNSFLSDLVPANVMLQSLTSARYDLRFYEDDSDLVEDLVQSTRQLNESSRSSLRTIVNIREAYSNIMTNNLNRRVGLLTSLTVVLTIPTIVFSLFGMNVPLPDQHDPRVTIGVIVLTFALMGAIIYFLAKKRWL